VEGVRVNDASVSELKPAQTQRAWNKEKITMNSLICYGSAFAVLLSATASGSAQPIITKQPAPLSVSLGANVMNLVTATGTLPLTYQWRLNELALMNATNRTLVFTNVQLTHAGGYSVVVSDTTGSVTSQVATLTVDATFTKINAGEIVNDLANSWGGTWADYNNDDYLDLFVGNNGQNNSLYRNNRDGTFTKMTTSNVGTIVNTSGINSGEGNWGDYDNDGHLDLFVATYGNDRLYHNNGDGTFARVTTGVVVTTTGNSEIGQWGDFDNDGFIDLFVSNIGTFAPTSDQNLLFQNKGDGTFVRITSGPPVNLARRWTGGGWTDYDNDGDLDLFAANLNDKNGLYRNDGGGKFTPIINGSIVTESHSTWGCAWGDYDNDGDMDLFVSNGPEKSLLYRNNRDGTFDKITNSAVNITLSRDSVANASGGAAWGDYDNDGHLDLFMTGYPTQTNALFHNNGDGTFTRITTGSLVNDRANSWGCVWGDYDNDGFLDLFVATGGFEGAQKNFLYRNNGNSNSWIKFKLVGTRSNRAGIGAKVRVKAMIGGSERWQMREVFSGSGYSSAGDLRASFGLGDATNVDLVRIEWPSGTIQELHNVATKQIPTVAEPAQLQVTGQGQFQIRSWVGQKFRVETSTDLAGWKPLATATNLTGVLRFSDADAVNLPRRFYRVVTE
jgi:hypothetical protein